MIVTGAQILLKTRKLNPSAKLPERSHEGDAGLDLFAVDDVPVDRHLLLIPTGVAIELPFGTVGLILDRSSMAIKGFHVYGGVIDSNYRGEVKVVLAKTVHGKVSDLIIKAGTKVAQLVIVPIILPDIYEVDNLSESDRGSNGFGSTGV